jgi:hypothetical protein
MSEKYLKMVLFDMSSPAPIPRCLDFLDQVINCVANGLKYLTVRFLRREVGGVSIVQRNAAAKCNHMAYWNAKRAQRRTLKPIYQSLNSLPQCTALAVIE